MLDQLDSYQREAWDTMKIADCEPHPGQTPEQARWAAIDAFKSWCSFDGLGIPSDEAIEREFQRRP